MDSYTTEAYMVHDKSSQQKQFLLSVFSCENCIHYYCSEAVFYMIILSIRKFLQCIFLSTLQDSSDFSVGSYSSVLKDS